ncbi:hypothetical protein [Streptomyces sp. NPDC059015]|uniref:hypothetical protein n=1 Tax=unclassified Streptomyces TaxID=2593676 RepID=UPI0036A88295
MSSTAYSRAYQGLVKGGMSAGQAAALLAELRKEDGEELAAGLRAHAKTLLRPEPTDTFAIQRKKKIRFGALQRAADWIADTAAGRISLPSQRTNRSNP